MAHILEPPAIDYLHPRAFRPDGTAGLILDAAEAAVAQGKPIVIREICRHLSLTPGAPYSYYESFTHLENLVAYNGLLTMAQAITASTPFSGDPRDRLIAACRAYRMWAISNPALFGFVFPTAGRHDDTPFAHHVMRASQAVAVPSSRALRAGWDTGRFARPQPGPQAHPIEIPGVVTLDSNESRIANALWITTHGAVVLELAMGIHDGWDPVDPMFDWLITTHISSQLDIT